MKTLLLYLMFIVSLFGVSQNNLFNRSQMNSMRMGESAQSVYPVIFIHGLIGNGSSWDDFTSNLYWNYDWTYGGKLEFCLNANENNSNADIYNDITDFIPSNLPPADYYNIEFNCNSSGNCDNSSSVLNNLSNQAAIKKQGRALGIAIEHVLSVTGKDKVILMGHSMGGLCAREYIQNDIHWQLNDHHRVAKLVTSGTPHGGSNAGSGPGNMLTDLGFGDDLPINPSSEAVRDLRSTYSDGTKGAYLWGGYEDQISDSYFNDDVDCNGLENDSVVGLNTKYLHTDIDYTCIVGNASDFTPSENQATLWSALTELAYDAASIFLDGTLNSKVQGGDGVVFTLNANLENFYAGMSNQIEVFEVATDHLDLTSNHEVNYKALDEPDFLSSYDPYQQNYYDLAYKVECNTYYRGYFTEQAPDNTQLNPDQDTDIYKFILSQNGWIDISLEMDPNTSSEAYMALDDEYLNEIDVSDQLFANGGNTYIPTDCCGIYLTAGTYYLSIGGIPLNTEEPFAKPYKFRISRISETGGIIDCDNSDIYGCMNIASCNYNYLATADSGSCVYPSVYYDCTGNCLSDVDGDYICDQIDACVGFYDECGVCNGSGPQLYYDCNGNCVNNSDNDSICDEQDNCPYNNNTSQSDNDSDGIGNACDNCPSLYNPNQEDFNLDGVGDACDGVSLNENNSDKKIINITDVLGRELSRDSKNIILIYTYDNGTVERKYILK